jgi:hypothetical protein
MLRYPDNASPKKTLANATRKFPKPSHRLPVTLPLRADRPPSAPPARTDYTPGRTLVLGLECAEWPGGPAGELGSGRQCTRMKISKLHIPITRTDLLRRSAVRLGFFTLLYLVLAWLWSVYRDDRLFHGFSFWFAVVLVPGLGLAVDLWRLKQTQNSQNADA